MSMSFFFLFVLGVTILYWRPHHRTACSLRVLRKALALGFHLCLQSVMPNVCHTGRVLGRCALVASLHEGCTGLVSRGPFLDLAHTTRPGCARTQHRHALATCLRPCQPRLGSLGGCANLCLDLAKKGMSMSFFFLFVLGVTVLYWRPHHAPHAV